jgi:23S rRNA pseudouridine1911/1915/1917 synthase
LKLARNFLHAERLEFAHPRTGKMLEVEAPLPRELEEFLHLVEDGQPPAAKPAVQSARAGRKRLIK